MSLKERQRQGEGAGAGKYPEKIGKYLRGSALAVTSLVVASSFAPQEAHALNPLHYTEDSGKAFEVQLSQRYTGDHKMHKLEYTMQAATAAKSTLRSATMLRGLTDKGESVEGGLAFDGPSGRFYFDY
ncbi:MAG TPA: hypothetical protein VL945_01665, partial [Candidatus Saccharimonadales bacterium]|nr:hypothetical protein [Candidatus Saccharimonadales bacterium]